MAQYILSDVENKSFYSFYDQIFFTINEYKIMQKAIFGAFFKEQLFQLQNINSNVITVIMHHVCFVITFIPIH
jgi:hypothetical protein